MKIFRSLSDEDLRFTLKPVVALLVTASFAAIVPAHADQSNQLFSLEPVVQRQKMQAQAFGRLAKMLSEPTSAELRLVSVRSSVIEKTMQEITVPIADNKTATFRQRKFESTNGGLLVWSGDAPSNRKDRYKWPNEVDFDPLNNATFVRDGSKLTGTLRVDGQLYSLKALENGRHVIIKMDESKFLPEAKPILSGAPGQESTAGRITAAHSTIRVMIVTTNQARAEDPNLNASITQALTVANQANASSGADITFELAAVVDQNYNESGEQTDMLGQIRDLTDSGLGAPVAQARDLYRADLVVMILATSGACGTGYLNATKANAFSVVNYSCLDAKSLPHEMGHNIGLQHNWEEGNAIPTPSYRHGYRQQVANPKFRTIMSYNCTGGCPRLDYWSNPNRTYQGLPMGTAQYHDAVRRINERREIVENFYP
ncbi:M12 family metallo-peptidase [Collimonas sp. NPDC087041]|uniref:M12 family metallo-peptidase n=1 Tax=Collimonas sp. NPDC087041 TaxID=3363960 RepID=UPI0037FF5A32